MEIEGRSLKDWTRIIVRGVSRGVLPEYIMCKVFGGYRIEREDNRYLYVRNRRGIRFAVPKKPKARVADYLYSLDPLNELNFHPYFKMEPGVFLDIGAFIGKYSLELARDERNTVIAIEPNPVSARLLALNGELNGCTERLRIVRKAITARPGTVKLVMEGSISAVPGSRMHGTDDITTVPATTLSRAIAEARVKPEEIKLVKIDVEGYQYPILEQVLTNKRLRGAAIICEIWPESPDYRKTLSLIKKAGYRAQQLDIFDYYLTYGTKKRK